MIMKDSSNLLQQLTGQSRTHIINSNELSSQITKPLHRRIVAPFLELQDRAKRAGFDLQLASGFRDFNRQLAIWNDKADGKRPLYDFDGQLILEDIVDPLDMVHCIMRWSTLPGASRHHWGTDIDVFDAAAVDKDYQIQLLPGEVEGNGVFAPLHDWLDDQIREGKACGFFRPYGVDRGGVAAERWHLSYAPVALEYQSRLDVETLSAIIGAVDLKLKAAVLANLNSLFDRYIALPEQFLQEDCRFI